MQTQGEVCHFLANVIAFKNILFKVISKKTKYKQYGKTCHGYENCKRIKTFLKIFVLIPLIIYSFNAFAWSLKTHVWISEQVLQDVVDDGKVTIDGDAYEVPNHIYIALKQHPDYYRMGNIGPDGFPDPIVGQTTTHPGVSGGWQTGEWLNHLIKNAQSPHEVAFAYGFVGHAAGDIFAHTYVNAYAGDIFDLTDSDKTEVELRHFVLEKFVEAHTPTDQHEGFDVPSDFLRDTIIYDGGAQSQYLKSRTGVHLLAMSGARNAVREFGKGINDLIRQLTSLASQTAKELFKAQTDLITAKVAFDAAQESLNAANQLLEQKEKFYQLQLQILNETINIIDNNPSLISAQEQIAAEQLRVAADAVDEAARLNSRLSDLEKIYNNLFDELNNTDKYIVVEVCKWVCPSWIPGCNWVCENVTKISGEWVNLNRRVTNAKNELINVRTQLSNAVAKEAAANIRKAEAVARKVALEKELVTRKALKATHEAAVKAAELDMNISREALNGAQKTYDVAREIRDAIAKHVNDLASLINKIEDIINRYNPLTMYVQNWQADIDKATSEYIETGKSASLLMLNNKSGAMNEYWEWYQCWKPVYTGVPAVVPQAICEVKDQIEHIKGEIDKIIASLPNELQWLLFPSRKIQERAEEELKPHLRELSEQVLAFITSPQTAEFIFLLSSPENATLEKLDSVYSKDRSNKDLLEFSNVSDIVMKDLNLDSNGKFDPNTFVSARNSVTLAKLALLAPDELNKLYRKYVPQGKTLYGSELYDQSEGSFSLLVNAVKSIDGNHQWQAYGLPYTRRNKDHISPASASPYGYDFFKDPSKGFRFWVDPKAREFVFLKLFPSPGVSGHIRSLPQLKDPHYPFQECDKNPYPETQNSTGNIIKGDYRCITASMSSLNPKKWYYYLKQNALLEFDCKRFSAPQKLILMHSCQ